MYVDTRTITIKFHDNERVTLRRSERKATKSESERRRGWKTKRLEIVVAAE